jgi:FkbM family methyltransferase
MKRNTPEYIDAVQRVKIKLFTEPPFNLDIHGLIHVGTNYGYEMHWYELMGIDHLLGVEPLPLACEQFKLLYPDIPLLCCALGERTEMRRMYVYAGDGQGSSLLHETNRDPNAFILPRPLLVLVEPFETVELPTVYNGNFNCLVIDVQGFELQVLKGFGSRLDPIEMISVELSREPLYDGEAPAHEVCGWLGERGFVRVSPIEDHNDVFFIRKRILDGGRWDFRGVDHG